MAKHKLLCVSIIFFLFVSVFRAQNIHADSFLYADYEICLKMCVKDGLVDVAALKENKHHLLKFLHDIHLLKKAAYDEWSRKEKLAFWINFYNASSLLFLLKHPYVESITEIEQGPKVKMFSVFGRKISLSGIKHMYLRGYLQDERIHFAIVSPAKGFPRLRNEAYLGSYINLQLEEDVQRFIQDTKNVVIDAQNNTIKLSPLFKWAAVDFVRRYENDIPELRKFNIRERTVLKFLSNYMPEYREFILRGNYELTYLEFNWDLNTV